MSYFIVNTAVANLYADTSHSSAVLTQALMGESCEIIDKKDNWYKIKQWDGYEGWIYYFYGIKSKEKYKTNLTLQDLFGSIKSLEEKNTLSQVAFGCELQVVKKQNGFIITFPDGRKGFSYNYFTEIDKKLTRDKIVNTAKRFLGIPYVWGGKTPFGFDCSGLVQTVFKSFGIELPRDAYKQEDFLSKYIIGNNEIKKGDLLFFSEDNKISHVAISTGGQNFINSRGFVQEESIDEKNSLFNSKLRVLFLHAVGIKQLLNK